MIAAVLLAGAAVAQQDDGQEDDGQEGNVPAQDERSLTAGEFRNNAYTLERGSITLHPLLRSHIGIAPGLDIKVPFLGQLFGPRASVEIAPVQSETFALSFEPEFGFGWQLRNRSAGGTVRATFGLGGHRLNLNAGAFYTRTYLPDLLATEDSSPTITEVLELPVNIGFDLVQNDQTTWRFVASSEVAALTALTTEARPPIIAGFNWNRAVEQDFRIALGVVLIAGGVPEEARTLAGGGRLPPLLVLPAPTIELWWKL